MADVFGAHADGALRVHRGADGIDILWADADNIASLVEPDVFTEDVGSVLEKVEAACRHRGQRSHAVVAANDTGGFPRAA